MPHDFTPKLLQQPLFQHGLFDVPSCFNPYKYINMKKYFVKNMAKNFADIKNNRTFASQNRNKGV